MNCCVLLPDKKDMIEQNRVKKNLDAAAVDTLLEPLDEPDLEVPYLSLSSRS